MRMMQLFLATLAALLMQVGVPSLALKGDLSAAAFAQDDDDGGDSDSDDDDDDDDSSDDESDDEIYLEDGSDDDGGVIGQSRRQPRVTQASVQRPVAVAEEIVVLDLPAETLEILRAEGFAEIGTDRLDRIGRTVTRLRIPSGVTLTEARDRVRALPGGAAADLNHYYRAESGYQPEDCRHENCRAQDLIGWQERGSCRAGLPIGVIDTGVNAEHEILEGARIEVTRIADPTLDPSQAVHGTAVVSLLAGAEESRVPGLVPEAEVVAVDVFSRAAGDERADLDALLEGLDLLLAREVRVINLSLAGSENAVLSAALDAIVAADRTVLVAAAGNGGPAEEPVWPAAHPGVIAVTAVDARGRIYRDAQRGAHIDLAAPGVGLLAATSIRGARGKSGTSYAVPFVTAAAALILSREPELGAAAVAERLTGDARDLGAEGADEVFGAGLLDVTGLCDRPVMAKEG